MTMACFEGYLGVPEATGILVSDVSVKEDQGLIALPQTKTSLNQSLVIRKGQWL